MTDRRRVLWKAVALLLLAGSLGYGSRMPFAQHHLPGVTKKESGDALWASVVFCLVGLIRPRWSTWRAAAVAIAIAWCVEFSQIYHRPWIDHIRSYRLGGMILGYEFLKLDLVAYVVGVALFVPLDRYWSTTAARPLGESIRVPDGPLGSTKV